MVNRQKNGVKAADALKKRQKKIRLSNLVVLALFALFVGAAAAYVYFGERGSGEEREETAEADEKISRNVVMADPRSIPEYTVEAFLVLHDNVPDFTEYDLEQISGEYYSPLDRLGRCGTVYAMLDRTMRPTKERGEIGNIRPSGWRQAKYPGIVDSDPPYLYNRCHLIAYALTGQNDNERNLITGTRYLNVSGMLPFELRVERYLDYSDNHVLYRVTPFFKEDELVARGVEMEAYSVEDQGEGVCFHVFVYNVQPGIAIDYRTGESEEK